MRKLRELVTRSKSATVNLRTLNLYSLRKCRKKIQGIWEGASNVLSAGFPVLLWKRGTHLRAQTLEEPTQSSRCWTVIAVLWFILLPAKGAGGNMWEKVPRFLKRDIAITNRRSRENMEGWVITMVGKDAAMRTFLCRLLIKWIRVTKQLLPDRKFTGKTSWGDMCRMVAMPTATGRKKRQGGIKNKSRGVWNNSSSIDYD